MIVIAPTIQQANAASGWNIDSAKSSGSRVILGATNGGYKSAINIPPNLAKITKFGMKSANAVGLIQIAAGLINDGVDFVLDPANNRIKYKNPADVVDAQCSWKLPTDSTRRAHMASEICSAYGYGSVESISRVSGSLKCSGASGSMAAQCIVSSIGVPERHIPMSDLATQVVKDAQSSDPSRKAAAQKILTDVAVAAVVAGDYDADLLAGAVPISGNETKPLIPSIPGSQVGDVDAGMTGGDVGAAAEQAREEADKARKQAQAAKDAATAAAEEARRLNDEAKDLINADIDKAIKDAATAAAAEAARAASDAKSVADAAAAEAARAAAESARAAAESVAAANEKAAAAEKAAADAAADATKSDVEKAAAQASADVAKAEAAAAQARAEAAEKAAAEAAAAKPEAKPFELPAFCTWAAIVCETAEWLKREPETPEITAIDTDSPIDDFDSDKSYITFTGSCPPKYTASLSIMGATAPFEFDYTPICTVMSYLKPFIVGAGYIAAAYIIAGHSRGSKD